MSQEIQEGLANTDSATEIQTTTETVDNSTAETNGSINPAWQGFLDTLPSEFVPQATPILQDWDKNFQEVQSANAKYKPYEEFTSHSPDDLRAAIQIMEMMNNDPRTVFDRLGQHHGYINAEVEQGNEEEDGEYYEEGDESEFDITQNPEFQQLQEQNAAALNYIEQQKQAEYERQADTFINDQFAQVAKLHGAPMNENEMKVLSDIALGQANSTGKPLNLVEAYGTFSSVVSNARNTSANNSAPPVMSGTGSIPVKPKSFSSENIENTLEEMLKGLGLGK